MDDLRIGFLLPTRDRTVLGDPRPAAAAAGEPRRVGRMRECVAAMRALWAGGAASYEGRHFTFHDVTIAPRPVRPEGPPIWPAGAPRDGADGWLPYPPTWQAYAAAVRPGITPAMYAGTAAGTAACLGRYVAAGARHLVVRLAVDDHETALAGLADQVLPFLREGEFA